MKFLQNLMSQDKAEAAEVLHAIAAEVESDCIRIINVEVQRGLMDSGVQVEGNRLTVEFVATGQHDDDILVGLA